jgi:hypothetical protein
MLDAGLPFWRALVTGPGGIPDEAAFVFLGIQPLVVFGSVFNALHTGHFAFADVVGFETGLIFLYNLSIGGRARLAGDETVATKPEEK